MPLLFIILLSLQIELNWNVKEAISSQHIFVDDSGKNKIILIEDSLLLTNWESSITKSFRLLNRGSIEKFESYTPLILNNQVFFIEYFGGKVYSISNDSLVRIDHSYSHRNQLLSSLFTYKDKIFRYGGYGFFDARNFFTYYDVSTNEWEVLETNSNEQPLGSFDSKYFVKEKYFYRIGGVNIDHKNRKKFIQNNEVWRFDLENKAWDYLGKHSFIEELKYSKSDFYYNNKMYFLKNGRMFCFDILSNNIYLVVDFPLIDKLNSNYPIYVYDDKVYFYTTGGNEKPIVEHVSVHADRLNKLELYIELDQEHNLYYYILVLIVVMTIILYYLNNRFKSNVNKITLTKDDVSFKKNRMKLDPIEIEFIKTFIDKKQVSIDDLTALFTNTEVTYSQQLRLKDDVINSLNTKLKVICKTDQEVVYQIKSEKDKRIRLYVCRYEVVNK